MNKVLTIFAIIALQLQLSSAIDTSLTSRNFQKDFLAEMSDIMKKSALEYLNRYIGDLKRPAHMDESFAEHQKTALQAKKLETKIVFLKQWFDMAEHRDANRANMYGLRNVHFLKKMKGKFRELQEESFEEMHNLRYYYLCKQFKIRNDTDNGRKRHHNMYSKGIHLAPILEDNISGMLDKLGARDNHTISVNVTDFGEELYKRVEYTGAELINDYLVIIKKLLQDVEENKSEELPSRDEALERIVHEIDLLLNTSDFYTKRQKLYDYLQNHLTLDFEEIKNSENSQQDLVDIFEKLKEKGLDLIVAFLFSNFEFVDYTHDQWALLLPQAPLALYEEANGSRALRKIQQLYAEFKQDFENSSKYDAYLEAVKVLHEQTKSENADTTHIYEMLYSASQNVGSSRATLMNAKCNEI